MLVDFTVQHVTIYLMLFVVISVHQFVANLEVLVYVIAILDSSQKTVTFVPMLEILFISIRTRALQLASVADETISLRPDHSLEQLTMDDKNIHWSCDVMMTSRTGRR